MRLGLHRMTGARDDFFRDFVGRTRPPFVKMIDDYPADLIQFCHAQGTQVIGRVYFPEQKLGNIGADIARVVEHARAHPGISVFELHNEVHQGLADANAYSDASIRFIDAMQAIGRKAAVGSFSVGQPELAYWPRYLPALRHAAATGSYVALHEYGGSDIRQGVTPDGLGWWMLRYRRAVAEWRRLGLTTIPQIIFSESGKDNINPDGLGGFRNRPGDYAADMAWYCSELSKDPYIAGVVDFGWATGDPQWNSFDLSQDPATLARMIPAMQSLPRGQTPAPVPVISPTVPPGLPSAPAELSACIQVRRGEGFTQATRRILGREPRQFEVNMLRVANASVTGLSAGQWLVSPWHRAVRV